MIISQFSFRTLKNLFGRDLRVHLVLSLLVATSVVFAGSFQSETSGSILSLVPVGALWLFLLSLAARSRLGILFTFSTFILSTTISRERLGFPLEFDAIVAPLLGAAILTLFRRNEATRKWFPLAVPVAGYVVANFLSTFGNSPFDPNSLRQSFIILARGIAFYLTIITVQHIPNHRARFPNILSAILLIQAGLGVLALGAYPRVETPLLWPGHHGPGIVSLGGLFQEPNLFGIFALSVTAMSVPRLLIAKSGNIKWNLVVATAGVLSIYLSFTRSTWLGAVIVMAALFLLLSMTPELPIRPRGASLLLVFFLVIGSVVVALGVLRFYGVLSPLISRIEGIFNPQISYSALGRLDVWRLAISDWLESPIIGKGLLSLALPENPGWLYSSVIQALHDSGILGLAFMMWLHVAAWRLCWKAKRAATGRQDKIILLGYLLSLIGIFVASQFSSMFWTAYAWLILGLAVGHSVYVLSQEHTDPMIRLGRPHIQTGKATDRHFDV